jgi:dephospho-CoA kinase
MQKIIIGFVGDLAAGKGTLASYLALKYTCNTYRFSTMLRDILDRIYADKTRENLQDISTLLRERFGQDIMSKVIAKDVQEDEGQLVVVDGIRRPTDISYLKELPGFHLVYVTADPKIRYERMKLRNENPGDAEKSFEQFLTDEQAEADKLIKELGAQAEDTIHNDGDYEELYTQIEMLLKKYGYQN